MGSVPESGRSYGGRHGNPLQYSCLGNPMDRGAWRLPSIRSQSAMTEVTEYACINAGKARKTIPNLCISEPPKDKENGAVLVWCAGLSLQQSPTLCDSMHCSWQAPIFQTQGPNPCLLYHLQCRQILTAEPSGRPPCLIHMLKVRLLNLQAVITSSESSYITQHLSWAYLLRMKRTSSFYFGPSLAFEQKMRLIKAQHLVLDQQTAPGIKAPAIVKSDQVRANWLQTTLIFKARLAFGSFCDSYRKGFHSSLTWWLACKLLWVSLLLNPYCSIVRKACKQEAPSVTSEWFEQTNIITRVFMEKCLSTEAERA